MKIILEKCKCPSWNDMQIAHWVKRSVERDILKNMVYALANNERKKEKIDTPARVIVEAHFSDNKRHDPDNLYVKPILDGLVQARIFEDDNGEIIESVTLKAKKWMPKDLIIISINE